MDIIKQLKGEIISFASLYQTKYGRVHNAVNWNGSTDDTDEEVEEFWDLNVSQFWLEREVDLSYDLLPWEQLTEAEKTTYVKVLGGLTLLDTKQGNKGMPLLQLHMENDKVAAVMAFMGAMENIHAKSYSAIFSTFCSNNEIDSIFDWVKANPNLQFKAESITAVYEVLLKPLVSDEEIYRAMVASVLLESFLFYSGFFYPLYLAGQGKLTHAGEIINLIIRDESIHGQFIGLQAQRLFETFDSKTQEDLEQWTKDLTRSLFQNEVKYAENVYSEIGLFDDVRDFIIYNANKAFDNLGFDHIYDDVEINPVVEAGLSTETKNHDFFSTKGNGYVKANVQPITDETFKIDRLEIDLDDEINALEEVA